MPKRKHLTELGKIFCIMFYKQDALTEQKNKDGFGIKAEQRKKSTRVRRKDVE